MTRWLWPILAALLFGIALSALLFDRIDHRNLNKTEWSPVPGIKIPLSSTLDFYVWAPPMVGASLLACSLFMWLYANSVRSAVKWPSRFPPVGPIPNKTIFEKRLDAAVRVAVGTLALGLGGYTAIHLFRHLLMHSVFDHTTKRVFHGPGLMEHLSHWSVNGDLRYGLAEGVTYYAGIQTTASLLLLLVGFFFGICALRRIHQ